jgi:DNA repair photolyase
LLETGLLDYLEQTNIKCYIQYTLNDYEGNKLELNVPPLSERIDTFIALSNRLGKNAVIWRFDPLILTDEISMDTLLNKIEQIGERLKGYTEKMVFSFADIVSYKKVESNLKRSQIPYKDWNQQQMIEFAKRLCELKDRKQWEYDLATCGEAANLEGIKHNRCIDGDLITKIAWKDAELMKFLKTEILEVQPSLFEPEIPEGAIKLDDTHYFFSSHKKDPGQRIHCGCMAAKDIGEYNTCIHMCEYCYANTSKQAAVLNNKWYKEHPWVETITGR